MKAGKEGYREQGGGNVNVKVELHKDGHHPSNSSPGWLFSVTECIKLENGNHDID